MAKDVALVLSSGGARGLAHIGAIEELEKSGYRISSIAGSSMGALIGGVYAAGIVGITPLKQYDREMAQKIMDVSFWAGVDFLQICTKANLSETGASFVLFSS